MSDVQLYREMANYLRKRAKNLEIFPYITIVYNKHGIGIICPEHMEEVKQKAEQIMDEAIEIFIKGSGRPVIVVR